jgi:hypothetical protein
MPRFVDFKKSTERKKTGVRIGGREEREPVRLD